MHDKDRIISCLLLLEVVALTETYQLLVDAKYAVCLTNRLIKPFIISLTSKWNYLAPWAFFAVIRIVKQKSSPKMRTQTAVFDVLTFGVITSQPYMAPRT